MTALTQRDAQRQHDARCDCCGDSEGEWLDSLAADMGDGERVDLIYDADIDGTLMTHLMFAWRTKDWPFIERQCERLVLPLIQKAARDEAERLGERP